MQRKDKFRLREIKFSHASNKHFHKQRAKEANRLLAVKMSLFPSKKNIAISHNSQESKENSLQRKQFHSEPSKNSYLQVFHFNQIFRFNKSSIIIWLLLLTSISLVNADSEKSTLCQFKDTDNLDLSDVIKRFKTGVIEGNIRSMEYQLNKYPQCKKELLESVSIRDLAILKKAELFPKWKHGLAGGCHGQKDDSDHLFFEIEDGHCSVYNRIPPTNSFDKVTNYLFKQALDRNTDAFDKTTNYLFKLTLNDNHLFRRAIEMDENAVEGEQEERIGINFRGE